jgi:hypothetical protein
MSFLSSHFIDALFVNMMEMWSKRKFMAAFGRMRGQQPALTKEIWPPSSEHAILPGRLAGNKHVQKAIHNQHVHRAIDSPMGQAAINKVSGLF